MANRTIAFNDDNRFTIADVNRMCIMDQGARADVAYQHNPRFTGKYDFNENSVFYGGDFNAYRKVTGTQRRDFHMSDSFNSAPSQNS